MDKVVPKLVRGFKFGPFRKSLDHREAILYALSVGCNQDPINKDELRFTYENRDDFEIIQSLTAQFSVLDLEKIRSCPGLPDYNPMALLHGEQVINFLNPLKIGQKLRTENELVDIADKKSGALVTVESKTYSEDDNKLVTTNLAKLFIRGIGGFGDQGTLAPEKFPKPSSETPIEEITLQTAPNQAHLYRIASGDVNPLHVDPDQAAEGGFKRPILHGLCTLGFSTRAYQQVFNQHRFKKIGTRFTAPTTPGQTLVVKFFETESKEQIAFDTVAVDPSSPPSEGVVIAKGFFERDIN
jgi:acyl dehydratase